jgi:hypothetical protein
VASHAQSLTKLVELLDCAVEMRSTIAAAAGALRRDGRLGTPKYNPSGSDGNASAKLITRANDERERWCRVLHQRPGEPVACVYQECLAHAAKSARDALSRAKTPARRLPAERGSTS